MSFAVQTIDYFDVAAKQLRKRYRSFVDDYATFIEGLKECGKGHRERPRIRHQKDGNRGEAETNQYKRSLPSISIMTKNN